MANSLKDLISSVDWSKMVSGSDARNALIGSALGGLLLGGAGLMAKRDPEESKYAPVGDALMGALLGGVAGYGIPKGLALFRDSGRLAPDNDKLRYNYLGWGLGGATAGALGMGYGLRKTLLRTAGALKQEGDADLAADKRRAQFQYEGAVNNGRPASVQDFYKRRLDLFSATPTEAQTIIADRRRVLLRLIKEKKWNEARTVWGEISELKKLHHRIGRGYGSFTDLIRAVGKAGDNAGEVGARVFDPILHPKTWFERFNDVRHYNTGPLLGGVARSVPAGVRMGLRVGKYGAVGGALGLLAARLFGPSSHNNFKE